MIPYIFVAARTGLLTLLLALPLLAAAFSFDDVAREAATLARAPYQSAAAADPRLANLSYDDYRDIRFRPERARWRDSGLFQLHFFPLGRSHVRPLRLYEVQDGTPSVLQVPASDFQVGSVARGVQPLPGAAGWRLSYPLNRPGQPDELIVFLGASYFRALGANQAYGLSARGLAVDTAGGQGEEFPAFTAFWFERPAATGARDALLRAARQPARDRRLPLRGAPGHRYGARGAGAAVPARAGRHAWASRR